MQKLKMATLLSGLISVMGVIAIFISVASQASSEPPSPDTIKQLWKVIKEGKKIGGQLDTGLRGLDKLADSTAAVGRFAEQIKALKEVEKAAKEFVVPDSLTELIDLKGTLKELDDEFEFKDRYSMAVEKGLREVIESGGATIFAEQVALAVLDIYELQGALRSAQTAVRKLNKQVSHKIENSNPKTVTREQLGELLKLIIQSGENAGRKPQGGATPPPVTVPAIGPAAVTKYPPIFTEDEMKELKQGMAADKARAFEEQMERRRQEFARRAREAEAEERARERADALLRAQQANSAERMKALEARAQADFNALQGVLDRQIKESNDALNAAHDAAERARLEQQKRSAEQLKATMAKMEQEEKDKADAERKKAEQENRPAPVINIYNNVQNRMNVLIQKDGEQNTTIPRPP